MIGGPGRHGSNVKLKPSMEEKRIISTAEGKVNNRAEKIPEGREERRLSSASKKIVVLGTLPWATLLYCQKKKKKVKRGTKPHSKGGFVARGKLPRGPNEWS